MGAQISQHYYVNFDLLPAVAGFKPRQLWFTFGISTLAFQTLLELI